MEHNAVRDVFEVYAKREGLRPVSEAPGLLRDEGGDVPNHERPADVLVIPQLALARELPDGSRAFRTEKVCFDFAIVNALGPGHWSQTAGASGSAAEQYDQQKRRRNNTETRCRERRLAFWPVVFEQQGGRSKAAHAAIVALAEAVGNREGCEAATIRHEINQRLAVLLARSTASMIARRQRGGPRIPTPWARAVAESAMLE
jgi:hypothetical protein